MSGVTKSVQVEDYERLVGVVRDVVRGQYGGSVKLASQAEFDGLTVSHSTLWKRCRVHYPLFKNLRSMNSRTFRWFRRFTAPYCSPLLDNQAFLGCFLREDLISGGYVEPTVHDAIAWARKQKEEQSKAGFLNSIEAL